MLENRRARGCAACRFSPDTQEMAGNVYTQGVTSVLRGYSSYSFWTPKGNEKSISPQQERPTLSLAELVFISLSLTVPLCPSAQLPLVLSSH